MEKIPPVKKKSKKCSKQRYTQQQFSMNSVKNYSICISKTLIKNDHSKISNTDFDIFQSIKFMPYPL